MSMIPAGKKAIAAELAIVLAACIAFAAIFHRNNLLTGTLTYAFPAICFWVLAWRFGRKGR